MKIYKETMKICLLSILIFTSSSIYSQGIPGYVPTTNLVGYYPFNGNSNDVTAFNNHGIVFGATLTSDRFNTQNSAFDFNGTNNYIEIPSASQINLTAPFTISVWFRSSLWSFNAPINEHAIISKVVDGFWGGGGFEFYTNGSSGINFGATISGNNINLVKTGYSINNWYHCLTTFNGSKLKMFINGIAVDSSNASNSISINNLPIRIGRRAGAGNFNCWFNGKIDDIGIWNRALTQQEITSLYQGCTGSVTASITPQGNTTFCAGNSVVLNATSGSGYTYQWSLNGNVINGATLSTISATQQGNYMVNIVAGGCTYPSNSINVNVNALPNVSINSLPNFINYFASPVQVIALPNGGISSGLGYSNGVFTPSIAGLGFKKIQYQYTDNNGCAGSASLSTIVYDTLCANPLGFIKSASNKIDLFPNPVQETITIKGNVPPHSSLEIFDTNGNLVFQELLSSENEQISIRQLKRALYHYRIINAGKILKSASIIKE